MKNKRLSVIDIIAKRFFPTKEKTWYEVFISNEYGSRTLEICDTLKEARVFKEDIFRKIDGEGTLHIDKWENIDNPKKIGDIE